MDVVKVFTDEPIGLEALAPDAEPDARRRDAPPASLESLLARPSEPYARAYVAGTRLGPPHRIGATALRDPGAWTAPLVAWAGGRPWTAVGDGGEETVGEPAAVLRAPGPVRALAVGPTVPGALAEAVGERRDRIGALRALLDSGAAVLFPEPAHDGHDWSLFALAPLRDPLVRAFRQRPAPDARRIVAPFRRARGEHTFYLEQWTLDALPEWAEEV